MANNKFSREENDQQKYYNIIADEYDIHYGNKYALKYRYGIYDKMLNNIKLKGVQVLDAMCGGGINGIFS